MGSKQAPCLAGTIERAALLRHLYLLQEDWSSFESSAFTYRNSLCKVISFKFDKPSENQSEETTGQRDSDDALFSLFDKLLLKMKFPELNEQATLIKAGKPYALYTQDTYMECHHLICELLESFTTAVKGLLASRNKSAKPDVDKTGKVGMCNPRQIGIIFGFVCPCAQRVSNVHTHFSCHTNGFSWYYLLVAVLCAKGFFL